MKKSVLFFVPLVAMALSGCAGNSQQSTSPTSGGPSIPPAPTSGATTDTGTPPTTVEPPVHATSMSLEPSKDQQAKVGDVLKVKATLSPSPTDPAESTFTWSSSNEDVAQIEVSEDTKSISVTCVSEGETILKATNDWNETDPNFTKSIKLTVLSEGRDVYIWQYNSKTDKEKFGYNKDTAPNGTLEGDADLNGITWHYTRQYNNAIASSSSALKLGKADASDGQVRLVTTNDRSVKEIRVEAASSDGSSFLTAKVGEKTFISHKTSSDMVRYESGILEPAEGDIDITFSASSGYLLIKSIVIQYDSSSEKLDSIELSPLSSQKTHFYSNEEFSSEGLKVIAHYTNGGEDKDVSDKVVVTPPETFLGSQKVKVSYTEGELEASITKELEYDIVVTDASATPVEEESGINGSPARTAYHSDENLDVSGYSVKIAYSDNTSIDLDFPTADGGKFSNVNIPLINEAAISSGSVTLSADYTENDVTIHLEVIVNTSDFEILPGEKITFDLSEAATWPSKTSYNPREIMSSNSKAKIAFEGAAYQTYKQGTEPDEIVFSGICVKEKEIVISSLEENVIIDSVKATFTQYGSKAKTVKSYCSYYDVGFDKESSSLGDITFASDTNLETKILEFSTDSLVSSSVCLFPTGNNSTEKSNQIFLTGLEIVTKAGESAKVSSLVLSHNADKLTYKSGEKFDPTGAVIQICFTDSEKFPNIDVSNLVEWDSIDEVNKTVTGHFRSYDVVQEGLTIEEYAGHTYTKIVSPLSDYSGTYLIVCEGKNAVLNGALDNSNNPKITSTSGSITSVSFEGGSISGDATIDAATFNVTLNDDGKYTIKGSKVFLGITDSGGLSAPKTENTGYRTSIDIDSDGNAVISRTIEKEVEGEMTSLTYLLGYSSGGAINSFASTATNFTKISLYKIAD